MTVALNVKRLEFGNEEQIKAVKLHREKLAEQDQCGQDLKDGIYEYYLVDIQFTGSTTLRVSADIATAYTLEPDDLEIDDITIRREK